MWSTFSDRPQWTHDATISLFNITSKRSRFDGIMTLVLRHVPAGTSHSSPERMSNLMPRANSNFDLSSLKFGNHGHVKNIPGWYLPYGFNQVTNELYHIDWSWTAFIQYNRGPLLVTDISQTSTGTMASTSNYMKHGGHTCQVHHNAVIMGAMASQITSLTIIYSTVYSGADQRKHQSSVSLAFAMGIHR